MEQRVEVRDIAHIFIHIFERIPIYLGDDVFEILLFDMGHCSLNCNDLLLYLSINRDLKPDTVESPIKRPAF